MSSRRQENAFCGSFFTNMEIDTVRQEATINMEKKKRSVAQTMNDYRKLKEFDWAERQRFGL